MSIRGFERASAAEVAPAIREWDASQRRVIELADGASAAVIGAPGSGKTSVLIELVAERVLTRGWLPAEVLALTTSRVTATRLRDRIAQRLGVPTNGPLARTVNSLAFEIVGQAAVEAGTDAPTLITGAEQDSDIAHLLQGELDDAANSLVANPDAALDAAHSDDSRTVPAVPARTAWPEPLTPEVRRLRAFRTELRELMARATEYGVSPDDLERLGEGQGRPEWVAASAFIREYDGVMASSRTGQLDSAELVQFATAAVARGVVLPRIDALRLVVVDDLQEATESTLSLLRALAGRGIAVVAFGDPDIAANAFRGGEPDALGRLSSVLGLADASIIYLSTVHRHGDGVRRLTSRVTERIGTAAAGPQRAASAAPGAGGGGSIEPVLRIEAESPARELAAIARVLRERHLVDGIAWHDMVVVVRSGARVPAIARALALADVPTKSSAAGRPLRDDSAARALFTVVDVGIGRTPLTPELAEVLLGGDYGGLDRLALRRLRLALRAEELAGGGGRPSGELLVEALGDASRLVTIDHSVGRAAAKLARILSGVKTQSEAGASIEELLWFVWEQSGLAPDLQQRAFGAGISAAEANRHLDGVVALFTAAKRFVERDPLKSASDFLFQVIDAEVPEDTLSPQSTGDAVLVTTPSGLVGLEFAVVVVAGVQEGGWPNLRIRGSLLHPQELVRVVTGQGAAVIDERKQVLGDELRMFALAVSRARLQVVVSAVANDDEAPSVLFALLPESTPLVRTASLAPLSLRSMTGRLRRELASPSTSAVDRESAAASLARLAHERVPGAAPADWHGLIPVSTTDPLYVDGEIVPVSPSRLERFEESPADWFIENLAGSDPSTAMAVGTILHWAMETATEPSAEALWAAVESRWGELDFEAPWLVDQQRRAARVLVGGIAEYLVDFERDGKTLIAAEGRFGIDLPGVRINGSIDRIERAADGAVIIVDLKTGTPVTSPAKIEAHAQLHAYQLAYAEGVLEALVALADSGAEHRAGGARLLFVKKGKGGKGYQSADQAALTSDQLDAFKKRVIEVAAAMAQSSFPAVAELAAWGTGNSSTLAIHRVRAVSSD